LLGQQPDYTLCQDALEAEGTFAWRSAISYNAEMLLFRYICWFLSLPLVWLGKLVALLDRAMAASILEAAWRIGGDGVIATMALACQKTKESNETVLARALTWLAKRPDPHLAAYAGILALVENNLDLARDLLVRGRALGDDPSGMFEMLELGICAKEDNPIEMFHLVRRLASRRDLQTPVSRTVCEYQLIEAMFRRDWPEMERLAKHLTSINNNSYAEGAFWALDRNRGIRRDLGAALRKTGTAQDRILCETTEIYGIAGAEEEYSQAMAELKQANPEGAENIRRHLEQYKQALT
jgi:hypothetical protein